MKNNVFKIDTDVTQSGSHVLQAGQNANFSFGPEDIKGITMNADGSLVISFNKGGELTIKNFEALANSGTTLTLADGTVVDPSLTHVAKAPVVHADNDNHMLLDIPSEGIVREITLEPGQQYIFNFAMEDVVEAKANIDGSYAITFENGGMLVLSNYDEAMGWDDHPLISADPFITTASNDALLTNIEKLVFAKAEEIEEDAKAQTKLAKADDIDPADLANIETAAGDEQSDQPTTEDLDNLAALADALAEVEPAAGDTATSSSNSGYGFNSSAASVSLEGKNAIGALGRTALNYNNGGTAGDLGSTVAKVGTLAIDDIPEINAGSLEAGTDETGLAGAPITASGQIVVDFGSDAPGAILPNAQIHTTGSVAGGTLHSNGVPVMYAQVDGGYEGRANGQLVFTFTIDANTGEYEYTQFLPIDHADGTDADDEIVIHFGFGARDNDGDTVFGVVKVTVADDAPVAHLATTGVDEAGISPAVVTGSLVYNYGADADGVMTTSGSFSASGSVLSSGLTSGGVAVTVVPTATGYVGMAGTTPVFTLHVNLDTGAYTYTQLAPLDHADNTDTSDVINLNFGMTITDGDGDSVDVDIRIDVTDDAPVAIDENGAAIESQILTGNLLSNDDLSVDGNEVTQVAFNGQFYSIPSGTSINVIGTYGILTVHSNGDYSYKANSNNPDGTDSFTYTLTDGDGDSSTANLSIAVSPIDDVPSVITTGDLSQTVDETELGVIEVSGLVQADFGTDGPGTYALNTSFTAGGSLLGDALTSGGHPVSVTLSGNTYTGMANGVVVFTLHMNGNGEYTFTLREPLDHADGNNADDDITLSFGFTASDSDDDSVNGTVTIHVLDDAPLVGDDAVFLDVDTNVATGNLLTNDDVGADGGRLTSITINGVDHAVPATGSIVINGAHGTLLIDAQGNYTYTLTDLNAPEAEETFTYTLTDGDGDQAVSTTGLTVTIESRDNTPVLVKPSIGTVDEDDIGSAVVNGQLSGEFFDDGFAGFGGTGTFNSSGSVLGGNLASNGVPVSVAYNDTTGTYTGTAAGATVFTLVINNDGSYTFTLLGNLDHANPNDPNDIIRLEFGVDGTDLDGDAGTSTITIDVKDSVPVLAGSTGDVDESGLETGPITYMDTIDSHLVDGATGVVPGGDFAASANGAPLALTSGGVAVIVTQTANGYVGTANGQPVFTLTIAANGQYTYTQTAPLDHPDTADHGDVLSLNFAIDISTVEGDTVPTTITINVGDDGIEARNDIAGAEEDQFITGDVLGNDYVGEDTPNTVTNVQFNGIDHTIPAGGSVTINGQFGTLTMNSDGTYSYQATAEDPDGTEVFTYTARDGDGDTDTATLSIRVTPDGEPVAVNANFDVDETNIIAGETTYNGALNIDFGGNAPGSVGANNSFAASGSMTGGALTSHGLPVSVALVGGVYVGTAGGNTVFTLAIHNDGTYTFKLLDTLDHANATDPNDAIKLEFGVTIADVDGDSVDGLVTIHVHDDAVIARADINGAEEDQLITGNVAANDYLGEDTPNTVTNVLFNGTNHAVPAGGSVTILGQFGTLIMNSDGNYSYQATAEDPNGVEHFVYTMRDGDGDTDTASLDITVTPDGEPVAVNASFDVDETNMVGGQLTFDGNMHVDFGQDGAGSVLGNNQFTATGSMGAQLTSNGQPVTVQLVGGVYIGSAGGQPVFTLSINNDGTYQFKLLDTLDHANASDPNDVIKLTFGVNVTDGDGDSTPGQITINVHDDAPVAVDDVFTAVSPAVEPPAPPPPPPPPPPAPDDAPIARADSYTFRETDMMGRDDDGTGVKMNVLSNDKMSADGGNQIVSAVFVNANGQPIASWNGTSSTVQVGQALYTVKIDSNKQSLTLSASGADRNSKDETMYIKYTIRDADGDTSSAIATVKQDDNTSPLVLDLDGDGIELINASAGTKFDMGSDGVKDTTSWVGKDDGLLVIDKDNNGTIDNQSELFGGSEVDGFSVLSQYDSNGDGKITNADAMWNKLQVWQDTNGDGISQAGELKSLSQLGISSINLNASETGTWNGDSFISHESTFTYTDGREGKIVDAWFNTNDSVDVEGTTYPMPTNAPEGAVIGNVLANDHASQDVATRITMITIGGQNYAVAATGETVVNGQYGKLTIWANGAFQYEPSGTNESAVVETFRYTVRDGDGDTNSANLRINVEPQAQPDDAPVAVDDNLTYVPATPSAPANTPPDAKNDVYEIRERATVGQYGEALATPLTVPTTINPWTDFAAFINSLQDGSYLNNLFNQNNGTVVNAGEKPVVLSYTNEVGSKDEVVVWKLPVLSNDTDPDGNPLTITSISGLSGQDQYQVQIAPDGKSVYVITHRDGNGTDSVIKFNYTVTDGKGGTDTASVVVNVDDNNSPLVLDLDGDGIELLNVTAGVKFDLDSNNTMDNTSWVGKDDGLLAIDKNNNGKIDNQSELFGSNSKDGFSMLKDYDSNNDGKITNADALWSKLMVWKDSNSNGVTDAGELKSLTQMGISSINLNATETGTWNGDSFISHESTFTWTNGQTGKVVDAWFNVDNGDAGVNVEGQTYDMPDNAPAGAMVGNVMANDNMSADGGNRITAVTVGGQTFAVAVSGQTVINSALGKLTIQSNGAFFYEPKGTNTAAAVDSFRYTLVDGDGDMSQANLNINLPSFKADDRPVANADQYTFTETSMMSGQTMNVLANDKLSADGGNKIISAVFVNAQGVEMGTSVLVSGGAVQGIGSNSANNGYNSHVSPWGGNNGTGATYTVSIAANGQSLAIKASGVDYSVHNEIMYIKYTIRDADGDTSSAVARVTQNDNTSPLVLDLDGNGIDLLRVGDGVQFDIDNDGVLDNIGWVGGGDALLALDKNGDGLINNQSELFGNNDVHADGFANLASYDVNADGKIDANDAVYADLKVWKDVNADGISGEGELLTLEQIGIVSINLTTETPDNLYIEGNWISHIGSFTMADGSVHTIADVWFSQGQDGDLYGTEGADTFLFQTIGESAATLHGFNALEGDTLDLSVLLDGQDNVTDAINDFVYSREENGSTIISVDVDGAAGPAQAMDIVQIDSVGLDIQQLVDNGNVII